MMWRKLFFFFGLLSCLFAADYRLPKAQRYTVTVPPDLTIVGSYYPAPSENTVVVVLLHMLGRNRGDWNECARFLQKEGYAVVSLDLPGHGESTNGRKFFWNSLSDAEFQNMLPQTEMIIRDIRQRLAVKKVALIGMGYGATLAMYAQNKGLSSAAVLIEPIQIVRDIDILTFVHGHEKPLYVIVSKDDSVAQNIKSLAKNCTIDVYPLSLNPLRWFIGNSLQYEHIVHWLSLHWR